MVMRIELTLAIYVTTLKFSEKFEHPFSHVFISNFGHTFPESRGFVALAVPIIIIKLEQFRLPSLTRYKLKQNLQVVSTMVELLTGGLVRKRVLSMTSSRGTAHKKLK